MGRGLISQIAPGELVVAADRSGEAFAQNLVKFKARDFAIAGATRPYVRLSDAMALGQVFVGNNAGAGEAIDILLRPCALLGIVQRRVNFLRSVDQMAQLGRVHRTGDIGPLAIAAICVVALQNRGAQSHRCQSHLWTNRVIRKAYNGVGEGLFQITDAP